jgi:histidine triad (HIT) family protein
MSECIFCRIANNELGTEFVFEDDDVVAFRDTNPQAPTHVLVIPRRHVGSIHELDDPKLAYALLRATRSVADDERLDDGYRVVTNVGPAAGQSVPHLHLHVLGGRSLGWPPG